MITNDDALTGLEDYSVAGELAAEDRLDPATLELVKRLDKSMRVCAAALGQRRVRSLTDLYYQTQKLRISTANQCRGTGEPTEVFAWLTDALKTIEHDICLTLGQFVRRYRCGNWLLSQCGIGPVIAAGLLSHLDVRQARTAGHYWSFAGLTQRPWEKGQKRPWNDRLKSLCAYKLGESFVKVQARPNGIYGRMFVARRAVEVENTRAGRHAADAATAAARVGKTTVAYAFYSGQLPPTIWDDLVAAKAHQRLAALEKAKGTGEGVPMLPPAHIHARARRYAVKMFLSHLHHVQTVDYFGRLPPLPYAFEQMPTEDHRHFVDIPNWSCGSASAIWPAEHRGDDLAALYRLTAAEPVPPRALERDEEGVSADEI